MFQSSPSASNARDRKTSSMTPSGYIEIETRMLFLQDLRFAETIDYR